MWILMNTTVMNTTVPTRRSRRGRRTGLAHITGQLMTRIIRIIILHIRIIRIDGDRESRWFSAADGIVEGSRAEVVTGVGDSVTGLYHSLLHCVGLSRVT